MPCNRERTVEQCKPHSCNGYYLYSQGNCLVLEEIGYVWSQSGMAQQPVIQSSVASEE